ncbi:MAG: tail fiber domain-containing protein [Candidatus Margulisiibacteriota bacterium]
MKKIGLFLVLVLGIIVSGVNAADVEVKLDSNDGTSAFVVLDSDATIVATMDSNGGITGAGRLTIGSDSGLYVGAGNDLQLTLSSDDIYFKQATLDKDIYFQVNDGGATTTPLFIDGSASSVGIGTAAPANLLQVKNPGDNGAIIRIGGNSTDLIDKMIYFGDGTTAYVRLGEPSTQDDMLMFRATDFYFETGDVGIGTTAASAKLDVDGNGRFRSIGSGSSAGALHYTSDGTLTTNTSDIRKKTNLIPLQGSLDKVLKLQGYSFNWKEEPNGPKHLGLVAQEVEKVIPELVFTNKVDGFKGINYSEISAVFVEAIKELEAENKELKDRLAKIEAKMESLYSE